MDFNEDLNFNNPTLDGIRAGLDLLVTPGSTVEMRVKRQRYGFLSGYYRDIDKLAEDALNWTQGYARVTDFKPDPPAESVFLTLNPVNPDLHARAADRYNTGIKATEDSDILRRTRLLLDVDAGQPSGTSSSDAEHSETLRLTLDIAEYLYGLGFPRLAICDSGNGGHLIGGLDLPNNPESRDLVRDFLTALKSRYPAVDDKVFNASRICTLYGTVKRKGDSTPERPHRIARVLKAPDRLDPIPPDLLRRAIAECKPAPVSVGMPGGSELLDQLASESRRLNSPTGTRATVDQVVEILERHAEDYGYTVGEPKPSGVFTHVQLSGRGCFFDDTHKRSPKISVHNHTGTVSYLCPHDSCMGKKECLPRKTWDDLLKLFSEESPPLQSNPAKPEQVKRDPVKALVDLALTHCELYRAPEPYVGTESGDHFPVESEACSRWLMGLSYDHRGKVAKKTQVDEVKSVLCHLASKAPQQSVYLRVARLSDRIYLDLADDQRRAIEITAEGWTVVTNPPVRFKRTANTGAMPVPLPGGSLDLLRPYLSTDDDQYARYVGFLLTALGSPGPYFTLAITGEAGSIKSTATRVIKRLLDPVGTAELISGFPRDGEDFALHANAEYLLASDNVSRITGDQADVICGLATGSGYKKRRLYTDSDLAIYDHRRPVIWNGITAAPDRGDLASRTLTVVQPVLDPADRRSESGIWAQFAEDHPKILGALCDLLSAGLRRYPHTPEGTHRIADGERWVNACLGDDSFSAVLREAADEGQTAALESSPVAPILMRFLTTPDRFNLDWKANTWKGEPGELMEQLKRFARDTMTTLPQSFPYSAQLFGGILSRDAPGLRVRGIDVRRSRVKGRRLIEIKPVEPVEPVQVVAEPVEPVQVVNPTLSQSNPAKPEQVKPWNRDYVRDPRYRTVPIETIALDYLDTALRERGLTREYVPESGEGRRTWKWCHDYAISQARRIRDEREKIIPSESSDFTDPDLHSAYLRALARGAGKIQWATDHTGTLVGQLVSTG